jgi:O-antigen ligase
MKSFLKSKTSEYTKPTNWIFGGMATVTLYFQTNLGDPFNSPKSWILLIIAAWLIGYIVSFRHIIFLSTPIKRLLYILLIFNTFALLSSLFTDVQYFAFFGETQRRNGFLSYLSLTIIMLSTSMFISIRSTIKLYKITLIIGLILVVYTLMQTTGNDFVAWNNPYNPVIGTLGNPNFAAALMAIIGVMLCASLFINSFSSTYKLSALIIGVLLLFSIYRSNARQGLLAFLLGVGVFLIIWLWIINKKYGVMSLLVGIIVFIFGVLGMLQVGPLEKYLYKASVSIRGHYWYAGLEMFFDHPFFGVGMDRYGDYFKEYRKVQYPLDYGFEITSTNAHNTFIQFFATGGFFLGASYLILNAYILRRAYFGILNLKGNNRLILVGVFSAWAAFQAQSFISIDNIGISIWGWVLGGTVIGLSNLDVSKSNVNESKIRKGNKRLDASGLTISGAITILTLILVASLYPGEANSYKAAISLNSQDTESRSTYKQLQDSLINGTFTDPNYKLSSAANLLSYGFIEEGFAAAINVHKENKRSLDALTLLAAASEQVNKISDAITYREKIILLDPWNAVNYLALGRLYKSSGDDFNSSEMLKKIMSFASSDKIAVQAKIDLTP